MSSISDEANSVSVKDPNLRARLASLGALLEEKSPQSAAGKSNKNAPQNMPSEQMLLDLPGLDDVFRAMPNHLARSSLFAPIARGRRRFHHRATLVSRSDAIITYTGEQLDEADADLCLQLVFEAMATPLGKPVVFNRGRVLSALGRGTGKQQYEWLHRRMKSLTEATLFVEALGRDGRPKYTIGDTQSFRIIEKFAFDAASTTYLFVLDPRWQRMFSNREYALIDWRKRLAIGRGQDMAKALQRLISASADQTQRYNLDWLQEKMQYTGRRRDFKRALLRAGRELERVDLARKCWIETRKDGEDMLCVWVE